MNTKFIELMRCPEPDCHGDLELIEETTSVNGDIFDGFLGCQSCNAEYVIKDGFPILLPETMDDESAFQELDEDELKDLREVS